MSTQPDITAIRNALSLTRIETYERAVVVVGDTGKAAVALYNWNAQTSGAFMTPMHICEVVIRNAVSDALTAVYGNRWPWSPVFEDSLPAPVSGYNPRRDIVQTRRYQPSTGKVIPELKFVFWQKMFTGRHDVRIWNSHLRRIFPNLDSSTTVANLRKGIYEDLEHIRLLRNRVAHHEPIFKRNLLVDFDKITSLIHSRCRYTAAWMIRMQRVTSYLTQP
jgi:hypothetical protein